MSVDTGRSFWNATRSGRHLPSNPDLQDLEVAYTKHFPEFEMQMCDIQKHGIYQLQPKDREVLVSLFIWQQLGLDLDQRRPDHHDFRYKNIVEKLQKLEDTLAPVKDFGCLLSINKQIECEIRNAVARNVPHCIMLNEDWVSIQEEGFLKMHAEEMYAIHIKECWIELMQEIWQEPAGSSVYNSKAIVKEHLRDMTALMKTISRVKHVQIKVVLCFVADLRMEEEEVLLAPNLDSYVHCGSPYVEVIGYQAHR